MVTTSPLRVDDAAPPGIFAAHAAIASAMAVVASAVRPANGGAHARGVAARERDHRVAAPSVGHRERLAGVAATASIR